MGAETGEIMELGLSESPLEVTRASVSAHVGESQA